MATFMETKYINLKLKLSKIAEELCCSSSTLQRYRQDINMLSSYRIPNSNKREQNISNHEHDLEGPQLTSNDLKRLQMTSKDDDKTVSKKVKTKHNLKGGDPNEGSISGSDPIEQVFSSKQMAEFKEVLKKNDPSIQN